MVLYLVYKYVIILQEVSMVKKYIISNYIEGNDRCMEVIKGETYKGGIIVSFETVEECRFGNGI